MHDYLLVILTFKLIFGLIDSKEALQDYSIGHLRSKLAQIVPDLVSFNKALTVELVEPSITDAADHRNIVLHQVKGKDL